MSGSPSVADVAVASTFVYRLPSGIALDKTPHVSAWIDRIEARPSWQTAVAPLVAAMPG